jgi:NAD(P)-dependent dehydrogenase (short-subunit alcohol dehydrogenase family)
MLTSPPMRKPARFPSLEDAAVFVTGGTTGIGAGIVQAFAAQGARVAFCGRNEEAAQALIASMAPLKHRVLFYKLDLRDIDALQSALRDAGDKQGPLAALVNNAADDTRHKFDELTPEAWDDRVAVNLKHMVFAAQEAARQMRQRGGGSIVNLSSISYRLKVEDIVGYVTCKAGVHGLSRVLAKELGPDNIRVNTLTPGWVMTERQISLWMTADGEKDMDAGQCLPARLMPEDIAAMALFLSAEDSRFCTAQDFTVDAGWS